MAITISLGPRDASTPPRVQAGIGYPMGFAIDLWQNPYTMAKLMIYGFCHVMGFPIVPWQNPWIL